MWISNILLSVWCRISVPVAETLFQLISRNLPGVSGVRNNIKNASLEI